MLRKGCPRPGAFVHLNLRRTKTVHAVEQSLFWNLSCETVCRADNGRKHPCSKGQFSYLDFDLNGEDSTPNEVLLGKCAVKNPPLSIYTCSNNAGRTLTPSPSSLLSAPVSKSLCFSHLPQARPLSTESKPTLEIAIYTAIRVSWSCPPSSPLFGRPFSRVDSPL